MRLLLVDDEADIQGFPRRSLHEEGYEVEVAPDAKTAQRLADVSQFDILAVDLGLPDRDGISLILHLRELGLKAPVLILSARPGLCRCGYPGSRRDRRSLESGSWRRIDYHYLALGRDGNSTSSGLSRGSAGWLIRLKGIC